MELTIQENDKLAREYLNLKSPREVDYPAFVLRNLHRLINEDKEKRNE